MPKDQATKADTSPLVELSVLFPIGGKVQVKAPHVKGEDPTKREQVQVTVRALSALEIVQQLQHVIAIAEGVEKGTPYVKVATQHFDDFCALFALASDDERDAAWFARLDGADFLRTVKTFLGANGDFFTEAADLFVGATARRVKAALWGGQTSSPNLNAQESATL